MRLLSLFASFVGGVLSLFRTLLIGLSLAFWSRLLFVMKCSYPRLPCSMCGFTCDAVEGLP